MPDVAEETRDVSVADLLGEGTPSSEQASETQTENTDATLPVEGQGGDEGRQEEVVPTLKDRVAELGFADVTSDEEAQQRLLEAFSQKSQAEQQYQQQLEMLNWQMRQLMSQTGQQVPQQQTQAPQPGQQGWWTPPQTNEQLRQQYIAGKAEDGSVQWKPNTPPQLIQEYEAEQAYYADWAQKLVRSPQEALAGFKQEILEDAKRQIQAELYQQAERRQAESFMEQQIRENEDFLYLKDPVTKQIRRDFQGNALLSEAGVRIEGLLSQLEQSGVANEVQRWQLAQQLYKAQYGDFKQTADQKMQQNRLAHLQKTTKPATYVPPRNGQEAANRNGRQQRVSMGERFLAEHDLSF